MKVKKILLGTVMAVSGIAAAAAQNSFNASAGAISGTNDNTEIRNNDTDDKNKKAAEMLKFNALFQGDSTVRESAKARMSRVAGDNIEATKLEKILMGNYLLSNIIPNIENTVYDYRSDQEYKGAASVSKFTSFSDKAQNFYNIRKATEQVLANNYKLIREQLSQVQQGVDLVVGSSTKNIGIEYDVYTIKQKIYNQFDDLNSGIYNKQTENITLANEMYDLNNKMHKINLEDALNQKKEELDRLKTTSYLLSKDVDSLKDKIDNAKALLNSTMNYALTTPNNKYSYEQYHQQLIESNQALDDLLKEKEINSDKSLNEKISQAKGLLSNMITNAKSTITNFSDEDKIVQSFTDDLNRNRTNILQIVNDLQYKVNKEIQPSYDFIYLRDKMSNALSVIDNINDYRQEKTYKDIAFVSQFEDLSSKNQNMADIQKATKRIMNDNDAIIKEQVSQVEDGLNLIGDENPEIIDLKKEIRITGQILSRQFSDYGVNIFNKKSENIAYARQLAGLNTDMNNIHLESALQQKEEDLSRMITISYLLAKDVDALNDKINNVEALSKSAINYALTTPNNKYSCEQFNQRLKDLNQAVDDLLKEKEINSDNILNEKLSQLKKVLKEMISKTNSMVDNFGNEDGMSQTLMNNLEDRKLQYRNSVIKLLSLYAQSEKETVGINNAAKSETETKYYNLGGQVTNPHKPGIYIQNGKKIIVK